jgi:UDP-N-acetylmuramate-alanine ligase
MPHKSPLSPTVIWLATPLRAAIRCSKRSSTAACLIFPGPQWLAEHVLKGPLGAGRRGTHGKTTVSAMLAWILEDAGLSPGFLIGGVPLNFGVSARLSGDSSNSPFFVIEADEYDTAFCDKRSKFMHYSSAHGDPEQP